MEVYLVQHGEAKSKEEDPERPLSEKGKADVEKMAKHLSSIGLEIHGILRSPKLRAEQTADILASRLGISAKEEDGLTPMDDPKIIQKLMESEERNLILVGHLPHLSRLASLLLTGKPEPETIAFKMGGVVCLKKDEKWKVGWMLTPELI